MEQNQDQDKKQNQRSLQDYLSLGYLYLLILGIFKDAIFYGSLGVNIINYSSVQDILLSPIIHLTTDIKRFLIFFVGIPLFIGGMAYLLRMYHEKNKNKDWYRAKKNFEKLNTQYSRENTNNWVITATLLGLFGAFIGFGLGSGQKISGRLEEGALKNNHKITFTDKESLEVHLIGHNSEYLFYAAEKDTSVTILPIQGNIKKIEKLE